ncbi:MAG: hypothetical protein ACR2GW_05565 [Pyrinomonadaceae bacterium]
MDRRLAFRREFHVQPFFMCHRTQHSGESPAFEKMFEVEGPTNALQIDRASNWYGDVALCGNHVAALYIISTRVPEVAELSNRVFPHDSGCWREKALNLLSTFSQLGMTD